MKRRLKQSGWEDDHGFTLVELIVAATVTGTVLLLGAGLYRSVERRVMGWRERVVLENNEHLVMRRLTDDLWRSQQLTAAPGMGWVLTRPGGDSVVYRLSEAQLYRNGERMHAAGLRVTELTLTPSHPQTRHAPLPAEGESDTLLVRIRLAMTARRDTMSLESNVALRSRRPWQVPGSSVRASARP